ncbi:MAG: cell surface protein SprA [Ignavibacteria bacterium]|nr:cell surface protein SprA [Ignavibacteria bacterium]
MTIRLKRFMVTPTQDRFRILAVMLVFILFLSGGEAAQGEVRMEEYPGLNPSEFSKDLFFQQTQPGGFVRSPSDTDRVVPGQVMSRRARAILQRSGRMDTTARVSVTDSLLAAIQALPRDSTARLSVFHHVRTDPLSVRMIRLTDHPLYAGLPIQLRQKETLDSTEYRYRIRSTVTGKDIRIPLDLSLEEYAHLRLERTIRSNWETMARKYEVETEKKRDLGDILGQVTNIEVPVPKNPIFSIFGPSIVRLQINGSVDVRGAFRSTKSDVITSNPLDQVRNEPDFNMELQVNTKGEIGDKLRIDADWNSERTFEYENQLKVRYKGYEDEIIQSVEAGNVSLPTNSSFISSNQALFGVKAGMQFGPLKLTTIASQKKGQIRELTVSGGGRPTPFEKRATDFSRDHFFVDLAYRNIYEKALKRIPFDVDSRMQIQDMEVWVTRTGIISDPNEREVVAFIEIDSVLKYQRNTAARRGQEFVSITGRVEVGTFVRLEPNTDYMYNEYLGYVSLNRSLQPDQVVAVAYTLPAPFGDVGNFGAKDTSKTAKLILKLIRPRNLDPSMRSAWNLMLKNIYPLGGRGLKKEGFELNVEYRAPGREPETTIMPDGINLMELFRIDRYREDGAAQPDGKFDYLSGITINENRGELIFPTLEPFGENIRHYFLERYKPTTPSDTARYIALADSFVFREVYDTTLNGAINSLKNNFFLKGNIVSSIASSYNIGFNVVEGSVEVIVDGDRKTPNVHYTVDYLSGQVMIKDQSLLVPGKNLQIKYEANDLFQLASKSLVGARGDLTLGKNSTLGFTFLNLNQETLSDKVRLGEEPVSNSILGFDAGMTIDAGFLTTALNWFPGIQTKEPSSIVLRGEAAYMLPDPNTRKSPIAQDQNKGIAYIDDFEGARKIIPLGVHYGMWRESSVPAYVLGLDAYVPPDRTVNLSDPIVRSLLLADTTKIEYKARTTWYNVLPSDVHPREIWPERDVRSGEDYVTVLNLRFRPRERGMYNTSLNLNQRLFASPQQAWGGVMRMLSSMTTNLIDENINFIEFWVRVDKTRPNAKLNINLGFLSEDVIPNGRLDTEDGLGGTLRTGLINNPAVQDVGLDGLNDDQERQRYSAFVAAYPQFSGDPSGDNYVAPRQIGSLNPDDYTGVNGPQNNFTTESGRYADTEDLNLNNVVDRLNSYFEYEISLDTMKQAFRQFVTGGGANRWYQIRIPINEYTRKIGDPTLTNIEAVRLWFTGADDEVLIRIAEFNLVGNQWESLIKNDSTFRVSVVNAEDNPTYNPPPGVDRPRDRTRPDQIIRGNEQSLALLIHDLKDGESRQAIKRFAIRPLDLFNYRSLKMFVHGDDRPGFRMMYADTSNYDVELFFRFGADSLNYYEYRAPIRSGWDPANEITIHFVDLTAIKLGRDSVGVLTARVPVPDGAPGASYQVRGEPTLTNVRYLVLGVENPPNKGKSSVTGEVWINEMRLTDVDDTKGWAYRFDTSIKFADVATITFGMTERDPYFHGLEERFGTRNLDRNWSLNAGLNFEKFLPESWAGTSIPLSYSHVEGVQDPRYLPGRDILVDEAVRRVEQVSRESGKNDAEAKAEGEAIREQAKTLSVTETIALPNIRFKVPIEYWLVTETINRMNFGFSHANSWRRNPTTERFNSWSWNFRLGYDLLLNPNNYVEPFAWAEELFILDGWSKTKLFFTPRNFNLTSTLTRGQTHEQVRNQTAPKPVARSFTMNRGFGFSWPFVDGGFLNLGTDYQLDIASSLVHLELDQLGEQRSFTDILGSMFGGERLIDFGIDQTYTQTVAINSRPVLPAVLKLDKFVTPTARYGVRYDWQNDLQAGDLGKSSAWSGNLAISVDINLNLIGNEIWSPKAPQPTRSPTDTAVVEASIPLSERIDQITRLLLKTPFFEFDRVNLTFSMTNSARHNGVIGRPGFSNMFGRIPFIQNSLPEYGPSLMYQLGLASDPHGDVIIKSKGSFPFVTGTTTQGRRAPLGNLTDIFSEKNRVNIRTSRPLWEGARVELSWNLGWSYNVNTSLATDSLGVPTPLNRIVNGDVERSFMTFPPILLFKMLKTSVEDVNKRYEELKQDIGDIRALDEKLAQAFEEGFEAIPIGAKILGKLFPRPNWSIRWDGLEKLPLLGSIAQRVSFDHTYNSTYKRRWKLTPGTGEVTESQQVVYGFAPLVGLTFTFHELGKGNLGASFRLSTTTSYDLTPAAQNIVEMNTTDISVSANYNRRGFEIPFFGLSLSNDLDMSFTYSYSQNSRRIYDMKRDFKKEGEPLEGFSRTTMEPRIRYILSSRVTASIYYKFTKFKPDEGGSRIPGSTINEGGLDVRVAIQ